ncbi:MAG: hypothetical protein HZA54_15275, partial [Planctomycetes bacterium]|nr:hypothetical protein [Planctomycetota bacterium]
MERTVGRAWLRVGAALVAVAALTALVGAGGMGGLPVAQAADEPVLKMYDIGFLGAQHNDLPGRVLRGRGDDAAPGINEGGLGPLLSPDDLIEAIRTNFSEDSWADNRHSIAAQGDLLLVVNRPPVLEAIQQYLTALRAR